MTCRYKIVKQSSSSAFSKSRTWKNQSKYVFCYGKYLSILWPFKWIECIYAAIKINLTYWVENFHLLQVGGTTEWSHHLQIPITSNFFPLATHNTYGYVVVTKHGAHWYFLSDGNVWVDLIIHEIKISLTFIKFSKSDGKLNLNLNYVKINGYKIMCKSLHAVEKNDLGIIPLNMRLLNIILSSHWSKF